jgi:hypothetical protein
MNPPAICANWERLCRFLFKGRTSRGVLRALIREDENAVGYDRNNVRAKAKSWLIEHGATLGADDIVLARDHFGYLLPMGWGS